ncbi:hypothetical protein CB1_000350004 [Camelus ferus]|nr:hypothetical protein CB1_000350004 [Camelus ferus]
MAHATAGGRVDPRPAYGPSGTELTAGSLGQPRYPRTHARCPSPNRLLFHTGDLDHPDFPTTFRAWLRFVAEKLFGGLGEEDVF